MGRHKRQRTDGIKKERETESKGEGGRERERKQKRGTERQKVTETGKGPGPPKRSLVKWLLWQPPHVWPRGPTLALMPAQSCSVPNQGWLV